MIVLTDTAAILAALEERELVPHPSSDPSTGSTMRLRAEMARFSGPGVHTDRRRAVVEAIDSIDGDRLGEIAYDRTMRRLGADRLDAVGTIAKVVPTEALATTLGLGNELDEMIADVEAVVRVIGRGEPATAMTDASTDRLLDRCGQLPAGGVAAVSLLYQNSDATAALIATTLIAAATDSPAVAAIPRTRRTATRDVVLAGSVVPGGSDVVLEIASAGLPFGAGPHQCPGRRLAELIVAAVVAAIRDAGYTVVASESTLDDDGRPTCLPITCSRSP